VQFSSLQIGAIVNDCIRIGRKKVMSKIGITDYLVS
jgi:hypothetical protein